MFKSTTLSMWSVFFVMCGISIDALAIGENTSIQESGEKIKDAAANKTESDKSASLAPIAKSVRPAHPMMVPVYPAPYSPVLSTPYKYQQRPGAPAVVPPRGAGPYYPVNPALAHGPVRNYPGYQPQVLVRPVPQLPAYPNSVPQYYYHQQSTPTTYPYAPYPSYGYRNAVDEETTMADQTAAPSAGVQYATRYLMRPQEYQADLPTQYMNDYSGAAITDSAYTADWLMPREMLAMEPANEMRRYPVLGSMDDKGSIRPVPGEATNEVLWEAIRQALMSKPNSNQQYPYLINGKLLEQLGGYSSFLKPSYEASEGTSWLIPKVENDFSLSSA